VTTARAEAYPSPSWRVTVLRPAGYETTLPIEDSHGNDYESEWLVSGGVAHPQNIVAARLASACRGIRLDPTNPLEWHRLDYIDPTSGKVFVASNDLFGGVPVSSLNTGLVPRPNEDTYQTIWARRCTKAAQTATFRRTVYLLGPPAELKFAHTPRFAGARRWARVPFSTIRLYINGLLVVRRSLVVGGWEDALDARALQAVRAGPNDIRVEVRKRKTAACNKPSTTRRLGVDFRLAGQHAWNLALTRPPATNAPVTGEAVARNGLGAFAVPYTLTNDGPSVLLEPVLALSGSGRTSLPQDKVGPLVTPGDGCLTGDGTAVCAFGPMAAGVSGTVNVVFVAVRKDREMGTPYLSTWQLDADFNGVKRIDGGSLCFPPPDKPDCTGMRPWAF
jgi:hypothetical protein